MLVKAWKNLHIWTKMFFFSKTFNRGTTLEEVMMISKEVATMLIKKNIIILLPKSGLNIKNFEVNMKSALTVTLHRIKYHLKCTGQLLSTKFLNWHPSRLPKNWLEVRFIAKIFIIFTITNNIVDSIRLGNKLQKFWKEWPKKLMLAKNPFLFLMGLLS